MKQKIDNQVACWDGYILHPILATLDHFFTASGYTNVKFSGDKTYSSAIWRKTLFDGYDSAFVLTSQRLKTSISGVLDLQADLQIHSNTQVLVENNLGLHECDLTIFREKNSTGIIASIGFNWLTQRWEPKKPNAYLLWHKVRLSDSDISAHAIFDLFLSHAVPFFNYIGKPEALANALVRPKSVPGYDLRAGSINSVSRFEYAAVILNNDGQTKNALAVLDDYLINIENGGFTDIQKTVHYCKERKLRDWILQARGGATVKS